MKRARKYGIKMLVLVMLLGLLTSAVSAKKVELTFWKHSYDPLDAILLELIGQFEQENPDIKINFVTMDDKSYRAKSLITFATKGGPDVFEVQSENRATFIDKDICSPINLEGFGVGSLEEAMALYEPGVAEKLVVDGEFRIVPFEWSVQGVHINKEHFRDSGLDPATDWPKTWEQVTEIGKRLVRYDAAGRITRDGFLIPVGSRSSASRTKDYHFDGHYVQLGGTYIDPVTGECTVNDSAGVAALQWAADLVNVHKVTDGPNDLTEFMANGQASMAIAGLWFKSSIGSTSPEVLPLMQTIPYPQSENGLQRYVSGGENFSLGVSNGSGHKEEAWRFVRFLTDNSNKFLAAGIITPVRNWYEKEGVTKLPDHMIWAEAIPYAGRGRSPLEDAYATEIAASLKRAIDDAILNKVPVETALTKAKNEIDAALSR